MKEEGFTKKYESFVGKTYSEVAEGEKNLSKWGVGLYKDRLIDFYNDPELIENVYTKEILRRLDKRYINNPIIADYGGGDGVLLDTVLEQLRKAGKSARAINVDITPKSLSIMREKFNPAISAIQGDVLRLPILNERIDIGLSRLVLNYFGQENQQKYLESIFHSLKNNGEAILMWPGSFSKKNAEIHSDFYAAITSIITGENQEEVRKNKYFPSTEEITELAKLVGFKVLKSGDPGVIVRYTPQGFVDRFNIDPEKLAKIKDVFEKANKQYSDDELIVRKKDEAIYVEAGFNFVVIEKAI